MSQTSSKCMFYCNCNIIYISDHVCILVCYLWFSCF